MQFQGVLPECALGAGSFNAFQRRSCSQGPGGSLPGLCRSRTFGELDDIPESVRNNAVLILSVKSGKQSLFFVVTFGFGRFLLRPWYDQKKLRHASGPQRNLSKTWQRCEA